MLIHIALVSDQTLANLIPILMEKPARVILVSTKIMEDRGLTRRLKRLIADEGIAVDVNPNAPDVGMADIHAFAGTVRDHLVENFAEAEIVLNATGGTKPMSFGFIEALRGIATRIIYTDTRHRRIELLPNGGEPGAPIPMTEVLDIKRYLAAQGLRTGACISDNQETVARMHARKSAAKYLARNAEKQANLIGALNGMADKALDDAGALIRPHQSLSYPPDPRSPFAEGLRELVKAKCIGWNEGEADIVFRDAEHTQFVRGGWLEEYAFHVLTDERLHDVRMGVNVLAEGSDSSHNEFDVLACHGNELLFIECKTLKHQGDGKDNEIAYKLKSLGDTARGLFGETWLLSARAPSDTLIERARQNRIRLIGPSELGKLRDAVRSWMRVTK